MLNETQQAVLKTMEENGDTAGAQVVLMDALNKTYAGQAQAAAKAAGGTAQFTAGLGETFETIGAELLPILDELGAWLSSPGSASGHANVRDQPCQRHSDRGALPD